MKKILVLISMFVVTHLGYTQPWVQVGTPLNTFAAPQAEPVIVTMPNGFPAVVYPHPSSSYQIAIFNPYTYSWEFFNNPTVETNVSDLRLVVRHNRLYIGYKSSAFHYRIRQFNLADNSFGSLTNISSGNIPYGNGCINFDVSPTNQNHIIFAYGSFSNPLSSKLFNGSVYNSMTPSGPDISSYDLYGKPEIFINNDEQAFILANFDEDMDLGLRLYQKQVYNTSVYWEEVDGAGNYMGPNIGAPHYDMSGSKASGQLPFLTFNPNSVLLDHIAMVKEVETGSPFDVSDLEECNFNVIRHLSCAGNNNVKYIGEIDGNIPGMPAIKKEDTDGSWDLLSSPAPSNIHYLDMQVNHNNRLFVAYREGSSILVKTMNLAPEFEDESAPRNTCQNASNHRVIQFLHIRDEDHDSVFVSQVVSDNPSVLSPGGVHVVRTGTYSSSSPDNFFQVFVTPQPGQTGTVDIELTFTDGFDDYVYSFQIEVVKPTFNPPVSNLCSNDAPVNLSNFANPQGGNFSGTGVNNGKFHPSQVTPGTNYTIVYTRYYPLLQCSAVDDAIITVNEAPSIDISTFPASCGNNDGEAVGEFSTTGLPDDQHDVYWSNGLLEEGVGMSTNSDLAPGLYFANVTNSYGCTSVAPASVSSSSISISGTVTDATCFNGSNGSVSVNITAPAGVASINWSNGKTTQNISGLKAGPYEITVVDNNGCLATASFNVRQPTQITWNASVIQSNCGSDDGEAACPAMGGTPPYTYQWFDGQGNPLSSMTDTQGSLSPGNYRCIITDDNSCSRTWNTVISDVGSPVVTLEEVTSASCNDDGAIDISIESVAPIQSIEWSNGATNEDIDDLAADTYVVEVTDDNSCVGVLSVEVSPSLPDIQPICMITVDTTTTTNKLIWEKVQLTGIMAYNIYRETSQANLYQLVATQASTEESIWTDTVASPMIRSWRYKIAAVDACGNEGPLSDPHKTMHVTINAGINDNVNLIWDNYVGFPFTQFHIWRHTDTSDWVEIEVLPSSLFSYTDLGMLQAPGLDYVIEIIPDQPCVSQKAQNHNSSRSNRIEGVFNEGPEEEPNKLEELNLESGIHVYPNPTEGHFVISLTGFEDHVVNYKVLNLQGSLVISGEVQDGFEQVDMTTLGAGVYMIQLSTDYHVVTKRIVKQ